MAITQNPTLAPAVQKSKHEPKAQETDVRVSSDTVKDTTVFLETFFNLYPTAVEKELTEFIIILFGDIPPLSMIEGAFLKYFGIPVALTWFMSQKTFDGKKPYSFLKSQITYALRPKITYAGKAVKLHKQILNETITAVRSVNYVPDKIY